MSRDEEICEKELRVRALMRDQGLDALALSTTANFAWLTCGGSNYVGIATEIGAASAVITKNSKFIVCDNIEAARIANEEVAGQGFEFKTCEWYEGRKDALIREIEPKGTLGSDTPIEGARYVAPLIDNLRRSLTPAEIERYRSLGKDVSECLAATANEIEPGMTEHQIAGLLDGRLKACGIVPIVTLVAVDERIEHYRHPIPTEKKLVRQAMLVTGARRFGLVVSATRIVHFGPVPNELRLKHDAVARVDAELIAATRVGARMGDVLQRGIVAYQEAGFADEWRLHHQGGPTGYKSREFRVTQSTDAQVAENQAFAWNPSITGTKTEDTIIATKSGPEIISLTGNWPVIMIRIGETTIPRPDIMVR
ncbi:MAG: M24 family metallopeptidase [Armatimonadetes bacterium]|nr:M24 family metallopeptidase [Armatimonadota bacterium]